MTQAATLIQAPSDRLLAAIKLLLEQKGIASAGEIAERMAATDRASPELGARAWTEPAFRAAMLADGTAAAESMGIPMRGLPPLGVLENTEDTHHLVVCTLCSCYPRAVLGYPPFWFKSPAYRARAVRDPAGVLAEWGTKLDPATRIRVVDSTADYRWMVLPRRPQGTEGWDAARLAKLVREGDMIGVSVPSA
jgi:hypothetical protein